MLSAILGKLSWRLAIKAAPYAALAAGVIAAWVWVANIKGDRDEALAARDEALTLAANRAQTITTLTGTLDSERLAWETERSAASAADRARRQNETRERDDAASATITIREERDRDPTLDEALAVPAPDSLWRLHIRAPAAGDADRD